MLREYLCVLALGSHNFDWLDNLRRHINVNEIIRVQVMSERDTSECNLERGGIMEECKRDSPCVCQQLA